MPIPTPALLAFLVAQPPAPGPAPAPADVDLELRSTPVLDDPVERALAQVRGGLTADRVAEAAVATAPTVAVKRAEVELAASRVDQTMYAFFPQIQLSAAYTRLSAITLTLGSGALVGAQNAGQLTVGPCPNGTGQCVLDAQGQPVGAASFRIPVILDNFSTQAALTVPLSDYVLRIAKGMDAARKNREAAKMMVRAEQLKVATDARLAYYDWLRALAQVAVVEDALERSRAREAEAEVAHRAGVLAEADRMRVQTLVANAERTVVQARAFEEVASAALSVLMDRPPERHRVGESPFSPHRPREVPGDVEVLVDEAHAKRLELRALELNGSALRSAIAAERAAFYPRVEGFADATYANPNQRYFPLRREWLPTWAAGARIVWLLNGALATRARVRELKAQRSILDSQVRGLQRALRLEVLSAYVERKNALASITLAEKAKISSRTAYEATALRFRVGTATATELIEAEGERIASTLQDVNARIDLRVADTKLAYVSGHLQDP